MVDLDGIDEVAFWQMGFYWLKQYTSIILSLYSDNIFSEVHHLINYRMLQVVACWFFIMQNPIFLLLIQSNQLGIISNITYKVIIVKLNVFMNMWSVVEWMFRR